MNEERLNAFEKMLSDILAQYVSVTEKLAALKADGKDNWTKRTVEEMLSNENYIDIGTFNSDRKGDQIYKLNNAHQAIISKETLDVVQEEKSKRSNMVTDENRTHRSNKKYSSKKITIVF